MKTLPILCCPNADNGICSIPMTKLWHIRRPDVKQVRALQKALDCHPAIATLLVNRNLASPRDALCFMNASMAHLRPPFDMKDMDRAVRRIREALEKKEKILIFGDYDADGVTATAILYQFLRGLRADVSCYIPHRTKEGYGLQADHARSVAGPRKADLIITVDCGSGGHEAVEAARELGVDVIITDHHEIPPPYPRAAAVVNPKREDCAAGFEHLAGVGVAFCLLICLRKHLRDAGVWGNAPEPNLKQCCDLVALGTIADMVPMVGENRIFARTGIDLIQSGGRVALSSLIRASGLQQEHVTEGDIAFKLAPRLNAAGRIAHADAALTLLTTQDPKAADDISRDLSLMNQSRQQMEKQVLDAALLQIDNHPHYLEHRALVLASPDWPLGVLGIAASRLVNRYYRPVVLISTENGVGKGSARSIPGVDLCKGLKACSEFLVKFGGHTMAAGLTVETGRLDRFRERFETAIRDMTAPEDFTQTLLADCELDLNDVSDGFMDELDALRPFGMGNPEPVFLSRNVTAVYSSIVGGRHRRMGLCQGPSKKGKPLNAIQFNVDADAPAPGFYPQIAYRITRNRWNGRNAPQIIIEEL